MLKNRLNKILFKITIFIAKKKNLIVDLSSRYKIIDLLKKSLIVILARTSLFKKSIINIRILSSSIF